MLDVVTHAPLPRLDACDMTTARAALANEFFSGLAAKVFYVECIFVQVSISPISLGRTLSAITFGNVRCVVQHHGVYIQ